MFFTEGALSPHLFFLQVVVAGCVMTANASMVALQIKKPNQIAAEWTRKYSVRTTKGPTI